MLTTGERLAKDFCENKRYLTEPEERFLANLIDARVKVMKEALNKIATGQTSLYGAYTPQEIARAALSAPATAEGKVLDETRV